MYPVQVVHDIRIPLRDGTRLAANLYLPDGADPVPAILEYTPYLKDARGGRGVVEIAQRYFAERGYACLTLDMRGFGASEGLPAPPFSAQEKQDGYDALAWIASQPWCDGRTGMWGISYGGDTALSVASTQPPSLKAIVPIHATDDEFTGVCYPHGCRGGLWGDNDWGFMMVGLQLLPPLRFADEGRWARLWRERLDHLEPVPFAWHTIPPSTWATWRTDVAAIQAATYVVSAWHDVYPAETLRAYHAIAAPKRALIGPWKHEFPDRAVHHPIGFWHEMTRWWDQWLKGLATGIMEEPPIVAFRQPDGGYYCEDTWPPAGARVLDYVMQPDGHLALGAAAQTGIDRYRVDPTVGLAHLPWDWITPTPAAPADISPDDHRALTYTTLPLDADLEIAGQPEVVVHLSADQPDFPLAAWLSDVTPHGYATLICQGWVRPAHLLGQALQADHIYEVGIPLLPTSYRLPAGHRLRLAIAGADFPVLVAAPTNPLLNLHRGGSYPSLLRLPVVTERGERRAMFTPPLTESPRAVLFDQSRHLVSRDLLGRTATHQRHQNAMYCLDDDTSLHVEVDASIAVDAEAPRHLTMQGTQTLTVQRSVTTIVIHATILETFDHLHIAAEITVDGAPFYGRSWDLDLSTAAWRWQTTADAAASPGGA